MKRRIVVFGLSITSSWGNGHATTYRGLLCELARRGHSIVFAERVVPWYSENRDLARPSFCELFLYRTFEELRTSRILDDADFAIVGSYVPDGVSIGDWVLANARCPVAFYDIDTPVTLAKLEREDYEYIEPRQIALYDTYLSFTGGPTLRKIESRYGSPAARALYCSFDPSMYYPRPSEPKYDLAYMGTYSDDRQPAVQRLLIDSALEWPAGRFAVAGPQYPRSIEWPLNVERIEHLPPDEHRAFYNSQRFTLNVTRRDMIDAGWSPSVRLFEAAACAVPIISDYWEGLDDFFRIGTEILVSSSAEETLSILRHMPEEQRREIGRKARIAAVSRHTAAHRAEELESYMEACLTPQRRQVFVA
jgi:spore maturation protein CgeB